VSSNPGTGGGRRARVAGRHPAPTQQASRAVYKGQAGRKAGRETGQAGRKQRIP